MQLFEADSAVHHVEVPRVLHVVLIVGVVYNALDVAFVVAYNVAVFKDIFHAEITQKCFFYCFLYFVGIMSIFICIFANPIGMLN